MRKGIHPAIQIMNVVRPDGRLMQLLTSKLYLDPGKYRPISSEQEGKELVGQIARYRRRYAMHLVEDDDDVGLRQRDEETQLPPAAAATSDPKPAVSAAEKPKKKKK